MNNRDRLMIAALLAALVIEEAHKAHAQWERCSERPLGVKMEDLHAHLEDRISELLARPVAGVSGIVFGVGPTSAI